jgi:hypothetical protein
MHVAIAPAVISKVLSFFFVQEKIFSAGGPKEQAQDAMPARTAQKNARTRTIGMNLRSTRPGRPQRRKP